MAVRSRRQPVRLKTYRSRLRLPFLPSMRFLRGPGCLCWALFLTWRGIARVSRPWIPASWGDIPGACLALRGGDNHDGAACWITELAERSDEIREKVLTRLIERGILEADIGGNVAISAGVSRTRRYMTAEGQTTKEARLGIVRELFSGDIADLRDIVIIRLASAFGVIESMLSREELA